MSAREQIGRNPFSLGQSSGGIEVLESTDFGRIVRKYAGTDDTRFQVQYLKHVGALNLNLDHIQIPRIISEFAANSYTMEYMPGTPLGFFLEIATHQEVASIAQTILQYFDQVLDMSRTKRIDEDLMSKIAALEASFSKIKTLAPVIEDLLSNVKRAGKNCPPLEGWNHGDFSFENILVSAPGKPIVLIDFLDSPFESPLIDLGRFWLDAKFGWWASGMYPSSNASLNSKYIAEFVSVFCVEHSISEEDLALFTGFAILRIYPYTKDPVRLAFLKNAAHEVMRLIK